MKYLTCIILFFTSLASYAISPALYTSLINSINFNGIPVVYPEDIAELKAQPKDAKSLVALGICHLRGFGLDKDSAKAVECFQAASKLGSVDALFLLAHLHIEGEHYLNSNGTAIAYLHASNTKQAKNLLGQCYMLGLHTEQNPDIAVILFNEAIEAHSSRAKLSLAKCYLNGIGVDIDYDKAIELIEEAAREGNAIAEYNIGALYEQGALGNMNYNKALNYYISAANKGYVEALCAIAYYYANPNNPTVLDLSKSIIYLEEAIKLGNIGAINKLGEIYFQRGKDKQDYIEAKKYFELAVENGDTRAMGTLGDYYYFGWLDAPNYQKAFNSYLYGSYANSDYCKYMLGTMYLDGVGVKADTQKALNFFKEAAILDNIKAKSMLGKIYFEGKLVRRNEKLAIIYLRQAAVKKDPYSLYYLGNAYALGIGVQEDKSRALSYFREAKNLGVEEANLALRQIY